MTDRANIFVEDELVFLWRKLWEFYVDETSLEVHDDIGRRILAATKIVGPVPWELVPAEALVDGWFEWANERIGISEPDLPDISDLEKAKRLILQAKVIFLDNLSRGNLSNSKFLRNLSKLGGRNE